MAIQVRRGKKKDFNPDKMLPGEWAGTTDTKEVYFTFAPGDTKKMATYEDMEENIRQATGKITAGLTEGVSTAIEQANTAAEAANQAAETAQTSITNLTEEAATAIETTNAASSTATQAAKEAQDAAQEAREASNAVLSVNIATGTTPGIVKATEEITVAEDGSMTLDTEFTMPEEISQIISGENWKLILGKIAKLMENSIGKMTLADQVYPIGSIYMSVNPVNPGSLFGGTWVPWGSGRVPVGVNASEDDFNTVEKTGGSSAEILTTEQLPKHVHSVGAHNHGLNSHTHGIPALSGKAASNGGHTHIMYKYSSGLFRQAGNIGNYNLLTGASGTAVSQVDTKGNKVTETDGTHEHSVTTDASNTNAASGSTANSNAFSSGSTGSGIAHNNLQPYITCYMWKRTA